MKRGEQREKIRSRGTRRRSAADAGKWRAGRETTDGCSTGHPMLFDVTTAFELGRMPEGGGYPEGFIEQAARLMGLPVDEIGDVVHLCSGSISARFTFDLRDDSAASVRCDVRELPVRTSSVQWVMADPPYDREYAAEIWNMADAYPTPIVLLREACRILRPGGRVAFLHHLMPNMPDGLVRIATHGVTTGPGYRIRALTIAERTGVERLDLS